MDIQEENSWGIINIDPRNQNSSVDIKNFMEQDTDIELRKDNSVRTVSLDASSVETFNVETGTGTNHDRTRGRWF